MLSAIIEHLSDLLNSHQGHSCTVPQFGVLDFNDVVHNMPDAIRHLQQSIRATIVEHEHRLQNVSVRLVPARGPADVAVRDPGAARIRSAEPGPHAHAR